MIGPFGTFYDLGVASRFGYWMSCILLIGSFAYATNRFVVSRAPVSSWPLPAQCLAGAAFTGLPAAVVVASVEALFRKAPAPDALRWLELYGSVTLLVAFISFPFFLFARGARAPMPSAATDATTTPGPSSFLRRIPERLGTNLLYLATEDHYVRAVTDRGSDLILYRLSDAVAELGPAAGLQVHRSYWVANGAVASVVRDGHRLTIVLDNGERVPVSRTYRGALDRAGWLSRSNTVGRS